MPAPTIESVFPSDGATGAVLGTTIHVVFDCEIDSTTIPGNFLIEGDSSDRWTGPDMALYDRPDTIETENILESPDFKGHVQGTFSFELLDSGGATVSTDDTSGLSGGASAYRHRVIFTPNNILSPTTEYTVYVSGEEDLTDLIDVGIATRTVFAAASGLNTGTGDLVPLGGYIGTIDDIFRFTITKSGGFGVAEYEWYRDSDVLSVRTGIVSQNSMVLVAGQGVSVSWSGSGVTPFVIGDTFTVRVRVPVYLEGIYSWTFTTGSGSIISLPSSSSTSPLGIAGGLSASSAFEVLEVTPDIRENVGTGTRVITIKFNKNINASTVTDDAVIVNALPVNGDDSIPSSGELGKILSVVDDKLYIILQSGEAP